MILVFAVVELLLAARELAELGGADRREVGGVREQDAPAVAEVLVERDLAGGRLGSEIRRGFFELQSHVGLLRGSVDRRALPSSRGY